MDPARFQQVYDAMFAHNLRRSRQLAAEGEGLRQVRNLGYGRLISTFLWAVVERYLAPRTTKRRIFVCPVTSFDVRGEHVQLLQNPSAEEARRFVAQFMAQLFSRERPGICVLSLAISRIANAIGHVEGMCGDQSLEDVIIRRVECRAMSRAVDAIWHEYVFLRGVVQHPCARVADAWGLAPRAEGAPGAENVDMLAVVLRLHEEYHKNEENGCLDPRAVREMLRQYYWRDYYRRAHYTLGRAGRIYEDGGDIDLTCSWLFMVLVQPDDWPK